jgi:hypothetical protein
MHWGLSFELVASAAQRAATGEEENVALGRSVGRSVRQKKRFARGGASRGHGKEPWQSILCVDDARTRETRKRPSAKLMG